MKSQKKLVLPIFLIFIFASVSGATLEVITQDTTGERVNVAEMCIAGHECVENEDQYRFALEKGQGYDVEISDPKYEDRTRFVYLEENHEYASLELEQTESADDNSGDSSDDSADKSTLKVITRDQEGSRVVADSICVQNNGCKTGTSTAQFELEKDKGYYINIEDDTYKDRTDQFVYVELDKEERGFELEKEKKSEPPEEAEGPTADITVSDSSVKIGQSVSFDAFDSQEGDSPIKEYKWNFEDGKTSFDRAVSRSFDSPGEKQATLTVTDTAGKSDTDRATVSVREQNETDDGDNGDGGQEEPEDVNAVISVSNNNPFVGESVRFDGSRSEGNIKEYKWEFSDSTSRFGRSVFKSFNSEGNEQVWLRVTDTNGNSDTASVALNVREEKQCRVNIGGISFSDTDKTDDEAEASLTVTNTGEPQEVNVQLFADNRKVSDSDVTLGTGAERKFSDSFTAEKVTDVRAEVRTTGDPCGSGFFERSSTFNKVTGDQKPVARLDINPKNADVNEEIEFDAGGSKDLDGRIEEYEFDLDGDGDYEITSDDSEVKEKFFEETQRTARVRVTDNDGNTDTAQGSYTVRAKSRVSFSNIDTPENICSGESFDVTFTAENIGDRERLTIIKGEGPGDVNSYSTLLEEGESEEATVTFTPTSPGTKEFTIKTVGGNSDAIRDSIEVLDCEAVEDEEESGISMKVVPDRVRAGKSVKISGYVENAQGRENVEIEMNNRELKQVSTEPDGYYSTFIYPERTGDFELTAKTDQYRATRKLTVLPTVTVGNMETPETVFQGDKIEVCADVNSQKIPAVLLVVDGEIVESTTDRGTVCFDTVARKKGEVNYKIVGLARGERSSAEREVEVHEAKPEASSFPGQIASVESGRGIVKATIYNNNDVRTKYFVGIKGLPSTWTSTTEKEVILQPGEEREVFFYLTPREEGEFNPRVTITSDSEIVHTERVPVEVGGTKNQRKLSLYERLKNVFL
ncbi:MAG: hypothetical protein BRC28_01495 [Nanohaloarchaea archaeon SW_4_43_9]|nr:MAG: hypothetical protein BRC28_01495 [Nanohaloarchaea archaeon SW_4_43_9]